MTFFQNNVHAIILSQLKATEAGLRPASVLYGREMCYFDDSATTAAKA